MLDSWIPVQCISKRLQAFQAVGHTPFPSLSSRNKKESRSCQEHCVSIHKAETLGGVSFYDHVIKCIVPCRDSGLNWVWSTEIVDSKGTFIFAKVMSAFILNPPHWKKNCNTIEGHMPENLIWRLCDKILSVMKRKCSVFSIINALVPAKPLLIPNVLEYLGLTQRRKGHTNTEL